MALKDSMANGGARAWRFLKALVWHEGRMGFFRWFDGS